LNTSSKFSNNGALQTLKSVCNPTEGDWKTRNKAKTEFMAFVMKIYEDLYKLESRSISAKSSISVFCRLDIGLIQIGHDIQYFVNEVERTQTASLWTNTLKVGVTKSQIGLIGSTFANIFYKWLQDISSPYFA
jgi:hypothetical protein